MVSRILDKNVFTLLRRRLGQDLAAAIASYVLSQEIEAFLHMRDLGLLVGELEPSFLQEVSHERLDLITKKFLRCARDQEVIRIEPENFLDFSPCFQALSGVLHRLSDGVGSDAGVLSSLPGLGAVSCVSRCRLN